MMRRHTSRFLFALGEPARTAAVRAFPGWSAALGLQTGVVPFDIMAEPEAHFPYARPLRLGWAQAEDGSWHHSLEDRHKWEVSCVPGVATRTARRTASPMPRTVFPPVPMTANMPPTEP